MYSRNSNAAPMAAKPVTRIELPNRSRDAPNINTSSISNPCIVYFIPLSFDKSSIPGAIDAGNVF
jgi:hypothetical protein